MNISQLVEWNDTAQTKWKCEPWMQNWSIEEWAQEKQGTDMRYEEIIGQSDHAVMLIINLIA